MIGSGVDEAALTLLARKRAIAEAEELSAMLRYSRRRDAELRASADSSMHGFVACSSVALEIASAAGLSEGQVQARLTVADQIQSRTPAMWTAFQIGLVDFVRLREVSATVSRLQHPESVARLDARVVDYASTHTVAELRRWLTRLEQRLEPDEATTRADTERERRHVRITHDADGMSHLYAYLPSPMTAAIERRLHHDSRALEADGRTLEQKKADLLVSWATCNDAGEPAPRTDIAVVVDADILAGARTGFAESADYAWSMPVDWLRDLTQSADPFWWRMVVEPVSRDVLAIEYQGRYPPDTLKRALLLRDGTCSYPGCIVPAWACDIDHVVPWPHGPTNAANLEPKSRRHHAQKGHGLDPPRRRSPAEAILHDLVMEYAGVPTGAQQT